MIEIAAGDTVLLASSLIPGNENAVYRVINGLSRIGAKVVHKGNALVHASGHASAGELLYCYNVLRPRNVMPVHGEIRHLIANGNLAKATGVRPEGVIIAEDGAVIDLAGGVAKQVGRIDASYIFVDGTTVGDISEAELTDRRILGEEGFITIVAVVDPRNETVVSGPDVHARGFAENDSVFDDIVGDVAKELVAAMREGTDDAYRLQQVMRRVIGRWVSSRFRRRPMIIPVVVTT